MFVFVAFQFAYYTPTVSKDVFYVQGALLTMVHGQALIIITWNLQTILYPYPPRRARIHAVLVIGLYELLDPTT
jgi:hypothetical protein